MKITMDKQLLKIEQLSSQKPIVLQIQEMGSMCRVRATTHIATKVSVTNKKLNKILTIYLLDDNSENKK